MTLPQPHAAVEVLDDGTLRAEAGPVEIRVDPDGRIYNRNAIRKHLQTGETEHDRWLVAELDGVRLYIAGDKLLLTRRDLYP